LILPSRQSCMDFGGKWEFRKDEDRILGALEAMWWPSRRVTALHKV
jgi:hypothetical protein